MLGYHRDLLDDELRTNAYREAIRAVVRPGDVVVDLGAGIGVLSFFACEAGARRVYAIEERHAADIASFLASHLGFADRVTVLHSPSGAVEIPEKADVLVTETMGKSGLDEHILSSVLDARTRLLRDGGTIIPQRLRLMAAPVELPEADAHFIRFWERPRYGFDFSPLTMFASNVVYATPIDAGAHVAAAARYADIDLHAFDSVEVDGTLQFTTNRAAVIHGFAGWFDATLARDISLANATRETTHWAQAFLPLPSPVAVPEGTAIDVRIETNDGREWRWRGTIHSSPEISFDQITLLSSPPCTKSLRAPA